MPLKLPHIIGMPQSEAKQTPIDVSLNNSLARPSLVLSSDARFRPMCDFDSDSRLTQKSDSNSDSSQFSVDILIFLIPIPIPA